MQTGHGSSGTGPLYPLSLALLTVFLAALLAASVVCLAVGLQPAGDLKIRLDAMAPGGVARAFPLERVEGLRRAALGASCVALACAACVWIFRRRWDPFCRSAVASFRAGVRWGAQELRPVAPFLGAITALGCGLRLFFLNQPIRVDEATTYLEFVSKPLLYGISYYPAPNNHILHTLLVHAVTQLFGGAPWAIRLVALAAGTLMIPAAALAAASLASNRAALPAAALVAVSWPWVFYSANARGYTLAGLLFLLLIPVSAHLRVKPERGAWIWFVVLSALGVFALPVFVFSLVPLGLWVISARPRAWREAAVAALCTILAALLLYAPAITASGLAAARTPEMAPPAETARLAAIQQFSLALFRNWTQDLPSWAAVGFLILAAVAYRNAALPALAALSSFAIWFVYPVMPYTRLWLWLSLPVLLLVGCGFGAVLPPRRAVQFLVLALAAWQAGRISMSGSIFHSRETGAFPEASAVAHYVKDHRRPGDAFDRASANSPLQYELRRQGVLLPSSSDGRRWVLGRQPSGEPGDSSVQIGEWWISVLPAPDGLRSPQ